MEGYGFHPCLTASAALFSTSSGQPKSGKPWPRFTASSSRERPDMVSKMVVGRLANSGFIRTFPGRQPAQAQGHDPRAGAQGFAEEVRRDREEDGLGPQARSEEHTS